MGEIPGHVVGVGRPGEIGLMAAETIVRGAFELPGVAVHAGHIRMPQAQRKRGGMRERRRGPRFNCAAVALLAIERKARHHMVGIGGLFVVLPVARITIQRHVDKLRLILDPVAIIAAHVLVAAKERESRALMQRTHPRNILPRLKSVAATAIHAQAAIVRVGVAGLAIAVGTGEFQRSVALGARRERMPSLKGKSGGLVVEFYIQAQRRPSLRGMAITARVLDVAMWILRGSGLPKRDNRRKAAQHDDQHPSAVAQR